MLHNIQIEPLMTMRLTNKAFFFLLSTIFIFIFFYKQHNIISKIKQNKTADTYSTSKSSIKREGERKDNKNTKVTPLNNHVHSVKNTAKPQWLKAWAPPTRAVVHFTMRQFGKEATDPICLSTHCGVNQF